MSEKLCIKIKNQKQADFVTKVFEKLGYSLWDCSYSYDEEDEWFFLDTTIKEYLFDTGISDDCKECHNYKNFVFEFLKQHYCILNNGNEKDFLQKKLKTLCFYKNVRSIYGDISFPLFKYDGEEFEFFYITACVSGLVQISYDKLNSLLDSIEEYDKLNNDMKNEQKKMTVENTCFYIDNKFELAAAKAYLELFLKENNLENELVKTAFDGALIKTHKFFYLDLGDDDIEAWIENRYARNIVTYQKYAELIKEKFAKKSFIFSNGLEAQVLNGGRIRIGCKTFDKSFWKNCCEMLLVLGTTGLEIEDEVFNEIDIRRFEDFLK